MSHIGLPQFDFRIPVPFPVAGSGREVAGPLGWFAVYTTTRHEKKIAQHMEMREIEHFLPLYSAQRRWKDGSKVTLELPLFPSYIFVRIPRQQRGRVLEVPGVLSIVGGTGREPAVLASEQVEAIRHGLSQEKVEPHPLLMAGQRGRIREGAFAGVEGIVVRVRDAYRVVLTVELIMQSIAVEVDAANLDILS